MSNNNGFDNSLAVRPVTKFNLTTLFLNMDLEELYIAYKASRKHNKRSEDMVAFEVDLYANLRMLKDKLDSGSYLPLHNYSFMHRRNQKPREVFAAEPELKVMMAFALQRIAPLIEVKLSPRTFNNRIDMGAHLAVNTLIEDIYTVSKGYTSPCQIIKIDYKGYFPNMNRDTAWKMVSDIVNKEYKGNDKADVLYCLYVACFTEPSRSKRKSPLWDWADYPKYKSVYLQPQGVGGFIGYTFWQMVASLYPTSIDEFIANNISEHFIRYVDDTVIITDNPVMVRAMIPTLRRKLAVIGITLHPNKYYDQPYQHGVEFLGYHIRPHRIHVKRHTMIRAAMTAKDHKRGRKNYISAMNSYLGIIKSTSDIKQAVEIMDMITRKNIIKDYHNYKIN